MRDFTETDLDLDHIYNALPASSITEIEEATSIERPRLYWLIAHLRRAATRDPERYGWTIPAVSHGRGEKHYCIALIDRSGKIANIDVGAAGQLAIGASSLCSEGASKLQHMATALQAATLDMRSPHFRRMLDAVAADAVTLSRKLDQIVARLVA